MEGPSLVIACEEFKPFLKQEITSATGTASLPFDQIQGSKIEKVESWGKHLILNFSSLTVRIHFLMFGSYRIQNPRKNRIPKLELHFGREKIFFYSCAIKNLSEDWRKMYDWSTDLMSTKWDAKKALAKMRARQSEMVCDILMDQKIFSGLGNIMKNEILFLLKMHPETKIENLSSARQRNLVKTAESYAWQFYAWKKINQLKRNWQIMRKPRCPECKGKVKKRPTGKLARISHYCSKCQKKS
jgi:endonuclease-8